MSGQLFVHAVVLGSGEPDQQLGVFGSVTENWATALRRVDLGHIRVTWQADEVGLTYCVGPW